MKKLFALILVLLISSSAFAAGVNEKAFVQQQNLGRDRAGLQWWLTGYGPTQSGWYAVAREYYTNSAVKNEVINKLTGMYGVPYEKAVSLYFTEFIFEYTSDGGQYAEISRVFFDLLGEEICSYRTGHVIFNPVMINTVQSKGAAYAMGRVR